jgi:hypothetical protein
MWHIDIRICQSRLFDKLTHLPTFLLDMCFLTGTIMDYHNVSQGKTSIPGVDDGEECELTDVRIEKRTFLYYSVVAKNLVRLFFRHPITISQSAA